PLAAHVELATIGNVVAHPVDVGEYRAMGTEAANFVAVAEQELDGATIGDDVPNFRLFVVDDLDDTLDPRQEFALRELALDDLAHVGANVGQRRNAGHLVTVRVNERNPAFGIGNGKGPHGRHADVD